MQNASDTQKSMLQEALGFIKKYPVTGGLVLINLLVFLWSDLTGGSENTLHMLACGAAYRPLILEGEYYRLITCMFLHFGMEHLVNNMLTLCVLGTRLEMQVGRVRLLLIYLLGGLAGNLGSLWLNMLEAKDAVSAGASGAVFAVLGGLILVILHNRGRAQGISLRQILIMAALSLYMGFASKGVDNAAHACGLAAGFILTALLYSLPRFLNQGKR